MVVRKIGQAILLDDQKLIFGVVRSGVFALCPLRHILVIGVAHDGRPVAMPLVIGHAARRPFMVQTQRVSVFVRAGFGNVLLAVGKLVRERPGCLVVVADGIKSAYVGNSSGIGIKVCWRDDDSVPKLRVAAAAASQSIGGGLFRGYIDIEGRVVLRDAFPYVLDALQFGGAEGARAAVGIKRSGNDIRTAVVARIPRGSRNGCAVKVQEDNFA